MFDLLSAHQIQFQLFFEVTKRVKFPNDPTFEVRSVFLDISKAFELANMWQELTNIRLAFSGQLT